MGYTAAVLGAAAVGIGLGLGWRRASWIERGFAALLPVAAVTVAVRLLDGIGRAEYALPAQWMLAPSLALAKGYALYYPPDSGPIIDFMYGPVSALATLPAALASSPAPALWIAAVLKASFLLLPMAWIHLRASSERSRPMAAAGFLCFSLFVLTDPGLAYSAFDGGGDAPAIGLAACACAALTQRSERRKDVALFFAAAFAVLAVWAKQTLAPMVVALPCALWWSHGPRAAMRLCVHLAVVGTVVSLITMLVFGLDALWFNMFTVPSLHPWYEQETQGTAELLARSFRGVLSRILWPVVWLAILVAGIAAGGGRASLRERAWTTLLIAGVFLVPTAVIGRVKVGAWLNMTSPALYFLFGAATLCASRRPEVSSSLLPRAANLSLALVLLWLVVAEVTRENRPARFEETVDRLRSWREAPLQRAFEFARRRPGEVYFPDSPLLSLLAEDALHHSNQGLLDRYLAGHPPSPPHYRAHLPERMTFVAFQTGVARPRMIPEYTRELLPRFSKKAEVKGLEGWTVYVRRDAQGDR